MAKEQNKTCAVSIAQNPPVKGRQLELFNYTGNRYTPQICSIPGISVKRRDRYRVTVENRILGDFLNIDEAIALSKSLNSNLNNP